MRALTALLVALSACASWAETPVLRVGMEVRQPPWTFSAGRDYGDEDFRKTPLVTPEQMKSLVGLDIDVMKALARRLEVAPQIVPCAWFDLEPSLLAKRFDVILSSWTPNPRTPATIAASVPYYEWGLLVAVKAANIRVKSYRDLDGLRVGHYRDPAVERSLQALGQHGTLLPADAPEYLFDDLKAGKLDAVIFDSLYVRWRVGQDKTLRTAGEPLNRLGYHVGVPKADAALLERVQQALKAMLASDELREIAKPWESGALK